MDELERRCQILIEFAKWTALSAVGSGGPIKATKPIHQLLDGVAFLEVLDPSLELITCEEFDRWHRAETEDLCARATPMLPTKWVTDHPRSEFPVGWSAKLINVYLKTAAYAGDLGREGLREVLHPPVDNRLKANLVMCFRDRPEIRDAVNFRSITAIAKYEDYQRIIDGCRAAARALGCSLFEVAYFGRSGTPISEEVEHRFRRKWNIDFGKWNTDFGMWNIHSGGSGTPVPES